MEKPPDDKRVNLIDGTSVDDNAGLTLRPEDDGARATGVTNSDIDDDGEENDGNVTMENCLEATRRSRKREDDGESEDEEDDDVDDESVTFDVDAVIRGKRITLAPGEGNDVGPFILPDFCFLRFPAPTSSSSSPL